jgi:GLPGLI family protein
MTAGKILLVICAVLCTGALDAQFVQSGKITYERRTNIHKKFDMPEMRDFIKNQDKIKIESFQLFFNDTASAFTYVQPNTPDRMPWLTTKNSVYNDFADDRRIMLMDLMGSAITLSDSLVDRQWVITTRTRKIAGYECTRAIWRKDDSTNIYAWFTADIIPAVGPENVQGLPGAILGLATEDGGVVYFATAVESMDPTPEQLAVPKKKGKEYSEDGLRRELMDKMRGQPFADKVLREMFFW